MSKNDERDLDDLVAQIEDAQIDEVAAVAAGGGSRVKAKRNGTRKRKSPLVPAEKVAKTQRPQGKRARP